MKWIKSIFQSPENPPPRHNEPSPTNAIFEKLHRFLDDERAQNAQLPESYRAQIQGGLDCDEIPGTSGEFGRSFQSPIPVNGAFQQWIGIPMRPPELRRALEQVVFSRPKEHQDRLADTLSMLDIKEM